MLRAWKKVLFNKPDLDTVLTAVLAGVESFHNIHHCYTASDVDLKNPDVLCIEVGGTGDVKNHNFDHHDPDVYYPPACRQAYIHFNYNDSYLSRLVDYVSSVDNGVMVPVEFPSLSNVFSGMLLLLSKENPKLQFLAGLDLFNRFIKEGLDPFKPVPPLPYWKDFIDAKKEQKKILESEKKNIIFFKTKRGLRGGFLSVTIPGGAGLIYGEGCQIAVLNNPLTGKFTIASNEVNLTSLLKKLSRIEPGWGGRSKIIGSPWHGTSLSAEEIIRIVKEEL